MKGGEAIIKSLTDQGVDVVFGYPGGVLLPLYDVIYDSDMKHILVRHEQCAAHAADGYARASGKVGVCIGTSGPGATNLVTGIATAYMDSSPIIAIAGQVSTPLIGNDAFQEVDTLGMTMPITKHNFQAMHADEIPGLIKSAFYIANTGRPGPVVLDLPKDVQQEDFDFEKAEPMELPGYKPTKKGHPLQVKRATDLILSCKKPVILAGGGVILSGSSSELLRLSEILGAPVATSLMGKGSFPEDHPLSLGMLGMHGKQVANFTVDDCDCLIAIGCRFSDRTTGSLSKFAKDAKIVHIDVDPAEIGKNVDVDVPIVGDAKIVMQSLLQTISQKKVSAAVNTAAWTKHVSAFRKRSIPRVSFDEIPLKPQQVIKEISEAITDDTIVTTDVGQNQMWMAHYFTSRIPRTFLSSGGLGTMGFGFPAAIGAKVAKPETDVVAVCGDGGFLMVCQDLATIKDYDIPIVICVLDNRYLGMVAQWQKLFYNNRISHTKLGNVPDFVKLAESFDIKGEKVEKPGELKESLKRALNSGEPTLLDIVIDPDEILPMVPPGRGLTEIVGEYKVETEYPGEIPYKSKAREMEGD
ncbi:acetolactate synthase large subunit [Methanobacterium paludis]|uniref:Acetolactate synthase n=1 Tax=Methanobacterium paludis (strain DSM 25820 / JCM 18151 / SWAN1) TaxID=868131 RepID=F6D6Y1_METPW|nr:acetolactate synthase large subunit [Methanobacterium paludis]AEG19436.1 acetolactate synthase, large subunit, biosynthetic type [Methanobacterium paludis]